MAIPPLVHRGPRRAIAAHLPANPEAMGCDVGTRERGCGSVKGQRQRRMLQRCGFEQRKPQRPTARADEACDVTATYATHLGRMPLQANRCPRNGDVWVSTGCDWRLANIRYAVAPSQLVAPGELHVCGSSSFGSLQFVECGDEVGACPAGPAGDGVTWISEAETGDLTLRPTLQGSPALRISPCGDVRAAHLIVSGTATIRGSGDPDLKRGTTFLDASTDHVVDNESPLPDAWTGTLHPGRYDGQRLDLVYLPSAPLALPSPPPSASPSSPLLVVLPTSLAYILDTASDTCVVLSDGTRPLTVQLDDAHRTLRLVWDEQQGCWYARVLLGPPCYAV